MMYQGHSFGEQAWILPGHSLGWRVQVEGYSQGEHFGELVLRSVQPLQDPT